MNVTRRNLLKQAGAAALLPTAIGVAASAQAQQHDHGAHGAAAEASNGVDTTPVASSAQRSTPASGYTPVHTLNGRTLKFRVVDGVKEFHLIAEEIEHEFAPGCVAKCWGYNGSTPGPTIEAVEGNRVRILVTNKLPEPTTIHWHGILLPSGMDGVAGLNQPPIGPGETWAYEFTLRQHGTHMYHPHADEMTQMAYGMMGMFIIHPAAGEPERIDRDYVILLHNWALHPGTYRPDPSIMSDFDLWTFNSKVYPATEAMVARSGERVRVRVGNLSMWNHPFHIHGVQFHVTGGDGGRWPRGQWRTEVTELVSVGQTRDMEFVAVPGDWAIHCHMAHHTMNAMGHDIPNPTGVDQSGVEQRIQRHLPGYMAMGKDGMHDHQDHASMMPAPENTLPMMMGRGPHGNIGMGGMFTVIKVRDDVVAGDYRDPGWYRQPAGTMARKVRG